MSSGSLHNLPNLDPNKRRGPTFVADGRGARQVEVGRGPLSTEVRGGDVKERAEEHRMEGGGAQLVSEDKVSRPPQQTALRCVLT